MRPVDRILPVRCPGCDNPTAMLGHQDRNGAGVRAVGPPRRPIVLCGRCAASWIAHEQRVPPVGQISPLPGPGYSAAPIAVVSARHHDGVAASIVRSIKYRGRRDLAAPVGRLVADAIRDAPQVERGGRLLIVTWVPSVPLHRRERGYDVGALIAHAAARSLGTVAVPTLRRSDSTGQTGKSRQQRLEGPNLRANLLTCTPIRTFGAEILLIDDVMTTGTSLARAAFVLGSVGVSVVLAATFTSVHDHADRSWLSLPGDAR